MAELKLTPQQQAVVHDRGGNLLVSAAAGSGKTKVLVDRVLDRIISEGKNIHEFLIITFTNAAAAELRAKISEAISRELSEHPENRHLSRQLNLLQLSHISTVHAFCGTVIREYGYLMDIPSDFRVLEDGERQELLQKQLDQLLDDAYEKQDPGFLRLTDTLGAGRNDNALCSLVTALYEKVLSQPDPEKWLKRQRFEIDPETDLTQCLWGSLLIDQAKTQIRGLIERYTWAIDAMQGDEALSQSYLPAYEQQRTCLVAMLPALDLPWTQIAKALEMEYPSVRVVKYPDKEHLKAIQDIKTDGKKILASLARTFSRDPETLRKEQNDAAPSLYGLLELVLELDKRFCAEKRRKNVLDFSDQEHLAIRLLTHPETGQPTDAAKELSERFAEIMVDEYQDSNRVQEIIFRAIARGGDENRFLVGDVKQSIYGFRMAEPEMFLNKYNTFPEAESAKEGEPRKLILSRNFRSRPEILEAVNHTFRTVMSQAVGGLSYGADESLYEGLDVYPAANGSHVELHVLELRKTEEDAEELRNQKEAEWIARRIVELLNEPAMIREGDALRPVAPSDIAILFRSRTAMGVFGKALREAGLPVSADMEENLFETPEVKVLMNLLRVLNNPHQDIPLLAVLCSPLFRFSNENLAQIRAQSRKKRFYDAMLECHEPWCIQALERLQQLRKEAAALSADRLVWTLIHETGLLEIYSAVDGGRQRRANLLAVYQFARNGTAGEFMNLYRLIRMLERAETQGTLTAARKTDGITLTTIHKSKGLEYPVVVLPCLSQRFNTRDLSAAVLYDSETGIASQITDLENRIRYSGLCHNALKSKMLSDLRSEELRLLYVAMTRARDYLIMTYADKNPARVLSRLRTGAGMPACRWAALQADQLGKWVLLSALNRVEAGDLFALCGRPLCDLTVSDHPWKITYEAVEQVEPLSYEAGSDDAQTEEIRLPDPSQLVETLQWKDQHASAARTPSKLTATQMKGREKDAEAANGAKIQASAPQLRRPEFILEQKGLSATERGTAVHLFLQFADYSRCTTPEDVESEKLRLEDNAFMTSEQLSAVDPKMIAALFTSDFGMRLTNAEHLIREFKFSLMVDASEYYPGVDGEQILLQGVVDAAWVEPDGICVLDFKTARVTEETISERTAYYRGQLKTYKTALERILKRPVKEMYLYFLSAGREVKL